MFAVKNVVGYIENPGVGLGFWYVSIPINSYPLMFSKISSELKMRWLWHKPDFGGHVYRIRVKLAPGCDLPHDVFNGLVGSTTNTFRIQFDIYIPSYTTDDYDALIMNVVSLGSGNAVNPTDYIDTDLIRERLASEAYESAMKGIKEYRESVHAKEETKMERRIRTYVNPHERFRIKDIQFNGPATIVMWMDGTKTVVKQQNGEPYDQEKAIAMAISRRALGEEGYSSVFHAKEFAEKELLKLKKHLSVLEDQYAQMSNRKKASRHKSAVELESKIKSCKKGIKHFEKIIKKFTPPETIEQMDTPVNGGRPSSGN